MASNSTNRDALMAQFIALTGTNQEVALHALDASDWNIQRAVNTYYTGDMNPVPKTAARNFPVKSNPVTKAKANVGQNGKSTAKEGDDDVRAPIAPIKEVLVKDYFGFPTTARVSNWHDQPTVEGQRLPPENTLDQLFRPPIDLLFNGTWEAAKAAGEQQNKWLLVNIQNPREFECQVLNRDVWANREVRALMLKHFIFMQMNLFSVEGKKYVSFYHVNTYPHVAILDPRTGEKMLNWWKVNAKTLCEHVTKFLCANPSPGVSNNANTSVTSAVQMTSAAKTKPVSELSEEEQLKAAIDESLKMAQSSKKSDAGNSPDSSTANETKQTPNSPKESWKAYLGPTGSVNLQLLIRLPDGKREWVSFPAGTKMKALLLYISEKYGVAIGTFDLLTMFPKTNLTEECNEMATLEAVGIKSRSTLYLEPK